MSSFSSSCTWTKGKLNCMHNGYGTIVLYTRCTFRFQCLPYFLFFGGCYVFLTLILTLKPSSTLNQYMYLACYYYTLGGNSGLPSYIFLPGLQLDVTRDEGDLRDRIRSVQIKQQFPPNGGVSSIPTRTIDRPARKNESFTVRGNKMQHKTKAQVLDKLRYMD